MNSRRLVSATLVVRVHRYEAKQFANLMNVAPKYGVDVAQFGIGGFIGQKYMLVMDGIGHDVFRWLRLWHFRPAKNTWASRREENCRTS